MKRLLIVHNAGDFREAYRRRQEDGSEIYYGHGYVLDQLADLARRHGEAGYLCCHAPAYVERIEGGVTLMGADTDGLLRPEPALRMIADYAPTHLIIHGPMNPFLRWGIKQARQHSLHLGCILADSFAMHPLDRWLRFGRLAGLLNDPAVTLVGNHGINAARSLVQLGVRPEKVIAWDFPQTRRPDQWPVKSGPGAPPYSLLYVGSLGRRKGIGDVIDAMALLKHRSDIRLKVAGIGQMARFEARARAKGVADRVEFLGLVPNRQVMELMHASAAVIVPSRHSFPEGMPLTLYEALASRTPVIASDHPMFAGPIEHERGALVFPAGNSAVLAQQIERLLADEALYASLSEGAAQAWEKMQNAIKWGELIDHWMADGEADRAWLVRHAVA